MKAVKEIQQIYQEYRRQHDELYKGRDTDIDAVISMCWNSARKIENVYLNSRRTAYTEFAQTIGRYLYKEIKSEQYRAERVKVRWENEEVQ
tara:strand:+ start:575 stop:847 length:273 start_codon:yes stop_codon:yes gene_type:complete